MAKKKKSCSLPSMEISQEAQYNENWTGLALSAVQLNPMAITQP